MRARAIQCKGLSGLLLVMAVLAPATVWAKVEVTFPDKNLETAVLQALDKTATPIYDTELQQLTVLNAAWNGLPDTQITDLSGLDYCTEITTLQLQGNSIADISALAELTKLQELYLRGNKVSSLAPLAHLRQLHLVFLEDNKIKDIESLANNSGIDTEDVLNLTGNELNQMSYCTYIPEMEARGVTIYRSYACGTRVVTFPDYNLDRKVRAALILLVQGRLLDGSLTLHDGETGAYTLARLKSGDLYETDFAVPPEGGPALIRTFLRDDDDDGDGKVTLTEIQAHDASFTEDTFVALDADHDGNLTEKDPGVGWFISLDASDATISDLTGIQACIELESINLSGNRIADLSPLSSLNPNTLNLSGNAISDLTPLKRMAGLAKLEIQNQFVDQTHVLSDIGTVKELTGLTQLYAGDNAIADLSPLRALAFIQVLSLCRNKVTNIEPLKGLTTLLSLDLGGNNVSDVSALSRLTSLIRLQLGNNAIADLSPIESLKWLNILDLSNNKLTTIDSLASLVHLEDSSLLSPSEVYLHNDPTGVNWNKITNVTPLAGLPSLAVVTLYNEQADAANPREGNNIQDVSPLVGNGGIGNVGVSRNDNQFVPDLLDIRGNDQLNQENLCVDIPLLQTRDLTVYFDGQCCDETYWLTTSVKVVGTGTVTPAGTQRYCAGKPISLTATPAAGYRFVEWNGDVSGTSATVTVTVSADMNIVAVFGSDTQRYTLAVSADPVTAGTCVADPLPDNGTYSSGKQVVVTATPKTGYVFDHWELNSETAGSANPKTVTMTENIVLVGHFKAQGKLYTLTTDVEGSGVLEVSTTPMADPEVLESGKIVYQYEDGTVVRVKAIADLGWRFDRWVGTLVASDGEQHELDVASGSVALTTSKALTAVFVKDGYDYALAAVTEGAGTISLSPKTPPDGFQRESDKIYRYKKDTKVHVVAVANSGSAFDHWTGSLSGDIGLADVTMDANKSIRAVFVSGTVRHLTISVQGDGTVSPPVGEYTYIDGKQLTLIATPLEGARFGEWQGDAQGTSNITAITMTSDKTVTAVFEPLPVISALHPNAGAITGGDTVVIEGLRLQDATAVSFGGASLDIIATTSTSITVKTPISTTAAPNPEGRVDVVVTTPLGEAVKLLGFTYMGQPELGAVLPAKGTAAGGDRVLLRGKNLAIATQVLFGGVAGVIDESSREDTRLYVTTPAHAAGKVDIELDSMMEPTTLSSVFTYIKVPQIYSILPNQGSASGGDVVQISGDGLAGPKSVTFDGVAATVSQANDSVLKVAIPPHAAGTVDVSVTTDGGVGTLANGFNYFVSSAKLTCHVVSSATHEAITDASVQLNPVGRVVTENQSGDYVFMNVRPDDYSVIVTASSYQTQTVAVTVHVDESVVLDIQMESETKTDEDCGSIVKRLDTRIAEKVLPLSVQELAASTIEPNGRLAIRLTSDDGVDPASVWAALTSDAGTVSGGVWRSTTADDNRDGWVVFVLAEPLQAGETVTLTVGAVSAKGDILGPISQDYVVTTEKALEESDAILPREDSSVTPIPVVIADAKSSVYRIGPAGVYDEPVTVRIPVDADTDVSAIDVFYYSEAAEQAGWYRGGNVTGWLVPDSLKKLQSDGQTYVEIQVNHSGVLQIGQRMAFGASAPFDMHATGSRSAWLALTGVALLLGTFLARLLRGKTRANTD